jgi:outer membrane protein TolC
MTLNEVIDLALRNNPQTRVSWAQARAAASTYGSVKGHYWPTINLDVNAGQAQSVSQNPARVPAERQTVIPALTLTYLLLDVGGRRGSTAAAREALYAADLGHNATVQNVVLQAADGYFLYQGSKGLSVAATLTVETARTNLAAAERRHEVGLATIADVLQARTALSQAQLAAQSAAGNVQLARAGLAQALGLPANGTFEVVADSGASPVQTVTASVDSLIDLAVRGRPDLAAARALARQSVAQVQVTRSALFPTLSFTATGGRVFSNLSVLEGNTYGLNVGLSVPIFTGNSRQYDVAAAEENAASALARADQLRVQAIAQVFSSFYGLQTAAQRVSTAAELLTSATRSEEVARGRYAEGVGTILDLLAAQNALADARAQDVSARWTWRAALAQLAHDVGVLGPGGALNLPTVSDSSRRPGQ